LWSKEKQGNKHAIMSKERVNASISKKPRRSNRHKKKERTLCSLIRSAYRRVFNEWSVAEAPGEMVAIMVVLESGEKQSFKIKVNLDPR
jgi:hypothetical protein